MSPARARTVATALALASSAYAQLQFAELEKRPNNPFLVGSTIRAQAFLAQPPVGIYLTNVTADRIVP